MSLPPEIFAGTVAAWHTAIVLLGRAAIFIRADGVELPIVCGLTRPYRIEVIQAYGESGRTLTLRVMDLQGHEPVPFERVRHDGIEYTIAEVAAVWVNTTRVGYRCIAHGRP